MMAVRTNNDIEGWHHALNRRAAGRWHMPFYLLIDLLHREAKLSALQIRLVSEKKLKRTTDPFKVRFLATGITISGEPHFSSTGFKSMQVFKWANSQQLVFFIILLYISSFKKKCFYRFIEVYKYRLLLKFLAPYNVI